MEVLLNISKHFKKDILTRDVSLIPVVIITDKDNNILHTLSTHLVELNQLKILPIIEKVSSIKMSSDYEQGKLKINTLRCDLYNYYDVKDRFTDVNDLTGKKLYLFYKSPTTNNINIDDDATDYDCALMYIGEINRIKNNSDKLSIIAEDSTQLKISNKKVPYMSQDKLSKDIREKVLESYKDDKITIPVVFGKVDKAPTLPYISSYTDRTLHILFDIHPTTSNYKTFKLPAVSKVDLPIDNNYYLYIKDGDDYLIWNHANDTISYQNFRYSQVRVTNSFGATDNYLIPELQEELEGFGLWDVHGIAQRQVDSVSAGIGSIIDINQTTVEETSAHNFNNIEYLNNNAGYEKKWYRADDSIYDYAPHSHFRFDTGLLNWNPTDNVSGEGRWIILKLEKGTNKRLRNIKKNGVYIGNTFLASDSILLQADNTITPNSSTLHSETNYTGFFVCPISTEIWKNKIPDIISNINDNDNSSWYRNLINNLLIETEDDLGGEIGDFTDQFAPNWDTYWQSPLRVHKNAAGQHYSNYFGYQGLADWFKIQGLYYGDSGSDERILSENADVHDYIAIFEYYPRDWYNSNYSYQQRLKMDNVGFLQSVHIPNIREEEIFASIVGRKSYYYTEQIEAEPYEHEVNIPSLETIINGLDNAHPNFDVMFNAFYQTIINDDDLENSWFSNYTSDVDDSVVFTSYFLFQNFIYPIHKKVKSMFNHLYSLQGIREILQQNNDINEIAWDGLYSESFLKSIFKRLYEYIYQTDIDMDYDFNISYVNPNWNLTVEGWNQVQHQWDSEVTIDNIDLNQHINFSYSWDSFDIENTQDYINNLPLYLNQTIAEINTAIYDNLRNVISYPYWSEIDWYWTNQGTTDTILYDTVYAQTLQEHLNSYGGLYTWQDSYYYPFLFMLEENLIYTHNQLIGNIETGTTTDGTIEKPSDIVMNILTYELGYGRRIESQDASYDSNIAPDYNKFDLDSIIESRNAHQGFKMGFAINEKTDGKKLIEEILKESKSYPKFNSNGKFGLITIKEKYTKDDIDKTINPKDVIKYNISKTKREDIITSCKMFYRFDNGTDNYNMSVDALKIEDILPDYNGYDYYNLDSNDTHQDIELRYHTDTNTVKNFQQYKLLNSCNVHNIIQLTLPLSYIDISTGSVIHIPLLNNELAHGMDYSKISYLNNQAVYPLWMVMETNVAPDGVAIKAYQLHYLGTDGNHGYGENYDIVGNMNELNSFYRTIYHPFTFLPNWNYNPLANIHNNIEIPYGDISGEGIINVVDIIKLTQHITGQELLTSVELERINNINLISGDITEPYSNLMDVTKILQLVDIVYWNNN